LSGRWDDQRLGEWAAGALGDALKMNRPRVYNSQSFEEHFEIVRNEIGPYGLNFIAARAACRVAPAGILSFISEARDAEITLYHVLALFCAATRLGPNIKISNIIHGTLLQEHNIYRSSRLQKLFDKYTSLQRLDEKYRLGRSLSLSPDERAKVFCAVKSAAYASVGDCVSAVLSAQSSVSFGQEDFWNEIESDFQTALTVQTTTPLPLWTTSRIPADIEEDWKVAESVLLADSDIDWTCFVTFFKRMLTGQSLHEELMVRIFRGIPSEDFQAPAKVLTYISQVIE